MIYKLSQMEEKELILKMKELIHYLKRQINYGESYSCINVIRKYEFEIPSIEDKIKEKEKGEYCSCINEGCTNRNGITVCGNCLQPINPIYLKGK